MREPIGPERSQKTASAIMQRVNSLEQDSIDWLHSFSSLLDVKPTSIELKINDPRLIDVTFKSEKAATAVKQYEKTIKTLDEKYAEKRKEHQQRLVTLLKEAKAGPGAPPENKHPGHKPPSSDVEIRFVTKGTYTGFGKLRNGLHAWPDRPRKLLNVPASMQGLRVTLRKGDGPTNIEISIAGGATAYLLISKEVPKEWVQDLLKRKWRIVGVIRCDRPKNDPVRLQVLVKRHAEPDVVKYSGGGYVLVAAKRLVEVKE